MRVAEPDAAIARHDDDDERLVLPSSAIDRVVDADLAEAAAWGLIEALPDDDEGDR